MSCCEEKVDVSIKCCDEKAGVSSGCCSSEDSSCCCEEGSGEKGALEYFKECIGDEYHYLVGEQEKGRKVVGIYCEFTPRDLIMAAGAVPVCLCGTSQDTVTAAETVLPANLCPLIKSSYGYALTKSCGLFNMTDLMVAETTCDGKKKMYEILAEEKEMHILELTQKVDEERAFSHWLEEVNLLKERLEKLCNRTITNEKLSASIKQMNEERRLLRKVQELGKANPSIVSGLEIAATRYRVAGFSSHQNELQNFLTFVENRAETGYTFAPKSAKRVILTGCPTGHGTEKVIELIEESGGVVVAQETCSGIKPLYELVSEEGDPLTAIARKHFNLPCSCMTPNKGREELLGELAKEYQADAVVDLVWQSCHTYNVESFLIDRYVSNELDLPYLKVETDYSTSDREQLKVRIQTLLEIA